MIMRESRGFSLLLSLLVLSAIIISAVSIGTLILRELKITSSGVKGVQAFYVAESGLESALFEYRQKGTAAQGLAKEYDDGIEVGTGKYWRDVADPPQGITINLLENQVIEMPMFDDGSQASEVKLTWDINNNSCHNSSGAWLEVVQSYWVGANADSTRKLISPTDIEDCSDPGQSALCTETIQSSFPFIRLRALFGDACSLNIETAGFNLPGQLQLTSYGEVADVQQALTITVPTKAPQFGAFDYTIFSEETICKKGNELSTFCD